VEETKVKYVVFLGCCKVSSTVLVDIIIKVG